MILGIGNDLTNITRIEKALQRFGEKFENRIFTKDEQAKARKTPRNLAASYAKRFASKEACVKALGTGFQQGIYWHDMEIRNLATGQPYLHLTGGAKKRLQELTPPQHEAVIHLTMSDDYPFAQAIVIISAIIKPTTS